MAANFGLYCADVREDKFQPVSVIHYLRRAEPKINYRLVHALAFITQQYIYNTDEQLLIISLKVHQGRADLC